MEYADALHYDYFMQKGIKANIPDESGRTPLHIFCLKSRQCPEKNIPLTIQLITDWKKECELSNNLQLLKEALNTTENGLNPLQHLIKDNENLAPFNELIDLMKQCGATV